MDELKKLTDAASGCIGHVCYVCKQPWRFVDGVQINCYGGSSLCPAHEDFSTSRIWEYIDSFAVWANRERKRAGIDNPTK